MGRSLLTGAAVLAAALLLAGCAAGDDAGSSPPARLTFTPAAVLEAASGTAPSASVTATATPSAVGAGGSVVTGRRARSLTGASLTVRAQPAEGAKVVATLPSTTPLGSARVLKVLQVKGSWVQVALPVRPDGRTGWVRGPDVVVQELDQRIVVDLTKRTLQWWKGGVRVLTTPVAVGAAATPTPKGSFYVVDRVRPTDPHGTYGAFALGLSVHSRTLTEFGDGDAQIGIHGTNEPASIGTATTHGCVRVPDAAVSRLEEAPLGTPVDIVSS